MERYNYKNLLLLSFKEDRKNQDKNYPTNYRYNYETDKQQPRMGNHWH